MRQPGPVGSYLCGRAMNDRLEAKGARRLRRAPTATRLQHSAQRWRAAATLGEAGK